MEVSEVRNIILLLCLLQSTLTGSAAVADDPTPASIVAITHPPEGAVLAQGAAVLDVTVEVQLEHGNAERFLDSYGPVAVAGDGVIVTLEGRSFVCVSANGILALCGAFGIASRLAIDLAPHATAARQRARRSRHGDAAADDAFAAEYEDGRSAAEPASIVVAAWLARDAAGAVAVASSRGTQVTVLLRPEDDDEGDRGGADDGEELGDDGGDDGDGGRPRPRRRFIVGSWGGVRSKMFLAWLRAAAAADAPAPPNDAARAAAAASCAEPADVHLVHDRAPPRALTLPVRLRFASRIQDGSS